MQYLQIYFGMCATAIMTLFHLGVLALTVAAFLWAFRVIVKTFTRTKGE